MGLPTNQTKGQGCNPVSSNCVIWQGPDIPCLSLCHGDSVTDVVFKLATELCKIMDELKISAYDLTCFQPVCPTPESFQELIQFLIGRICKIEDCIYEPCAPGCECLKCKESAVTSACPDACIVTVAPCFQFVNQLGDTVTTMTLTDYVTAIGNKLCQLAGQIGTADARLNNHDQEISGLNERVTNLENNPVTITIPSSCLLGPGPEGGWPIVTVVENLEARFCELKAATGEPIALLQAVQRECTNLDQSPSLTDRNVNMGSKTGWIHLSEYNTVADSINNMWITICDLRAAVLNIINTCCCTDCDDVNITMTATQEGDNITLYFTGSVPPGMADCFPDGNQVTFTDQDGGSHVTFVEVINNLNGSVTVNLNGTPVNTSQNITITLQGCWNRSAPGESCGGLRCERFLTFTIINTAECPQINVVPGPTNIAYSFINGVAGPVTYTVELYTSPGAVFVTSNTHVNPAQFAVVNGNFAGLLCNTDYFILMKVTIAGNTEICPQAFVSTQPCPCAAPTAVTATAIP